MTTKEKIIQYLETKGVSKRDFYKKTGLSNGFLDSGKHIGSDNLRVIVDNYPDLNLEWLVMDKGEMIKNTTSLKENLENEMISTLKELLKSKNEQIDMLKEKIQTLQNEKSPTHSNS